MGHLSTHVLDTMHGRPAAGLRVTLWRLADDGTPQPVRDLQLNADGRAPGGPLLDATTMARGRWQLRFHVADYFRGCGVKLPEPPFLDVVTLDFGIADAAGHYHVPLLCTPWSHSTYRGS
ncbi:MAG: hypothetical protein RLY78_3400 [Pseudomonadota bacterium]